MFWSWHTYRVSIWRSCLPFARTAIGLRPRCKDSKDDNVGNEQHLNYSFQCERVNLDFDHVLWTLWTQHPAIGASIRWPSGILQSGKFPETMSSSPSPFHDQKLHCFLPLSWIGVQLNEISPLRTEPKWAFEFLFFCISLSWRLRSAAKLGQVLKSSWVFVCIVIFVWAKSDVLDELAEPLRHPN